MFRSQARDRRESVERAAQKLAELRLSRLVVCDGDGKAVGVLPVVRLAAEVRRPTSARSCVRDVMSYAIVTCRRDAAVDAAIRAMSERRSRSVVVIEQDRPVGVLTATDLLQLYSASGDAQEGGSVGDFMTTDVLMCEPELLLSEAVDRMRDRDVHRLVVVDPSDAPAPSA